MKELKVGILTSLALAAGLLAATAQSVPYYDSDALDYSMNAQFLNNPPSVVSVAGLPTPVLTDLEPMLQGAISTDNSGKIEGVQYAQVYFGGAGNQINNYATFIINVTGTIRTVGTAPVVKMTLKGNGYDADAQTDHPDASLSLKFTSTNGPVTVSPNQSVVVNSTNYTVTYLNGSPVLLTTNTNVPSTTYSSYSVNPTNYWVTFCFTNGPMTTNNANAYSMISGRLTGTIKPGKKSTVNGGKPLKVNEVAMLFTESLIWTVVDDTNFVQQSVGGSLVVDVLSNITAQVVQPVPGKKLYLAGGVGSTLDPFSGTGTVNYNQATYKAKLTGVSPARGGALNISGTLGSVIAGYQPTTNPSFPTGYTTNYLQNAIKQISFSGKAVGQKVPLTSGVNPDAPFP
jgi:hypothetical protein